MAQADEGGANRRMVDRLLFFSDAVFAIALTLLVLELRVPDGLEGEAALWAALAAETPTFVAVGISFALAGGWWLIHQAATQSLIRFDWPSALVNLVLLLFIVLFPFASAFYGEYFATAAGLVVYWGVNAGAAFAMTLLFFLMSRGNGKLLSAPIGAGERIYRLGQSFVPGVCFVFGIWFALNGDLMASRFCWMPIPLYMAIGGFFMGRAKRKQKR